MTYFGSVYGQIELKGKPPILSDEEIDEIDNSLGSEDWRFGEAIAEAQWAKAIEWFKKQGHEAISYLEGYQQARQDTEREIFEEIEKNQRQYFYIESWPQYNTISISRNQIKWQALKQKYLGGKENPIGYDGNTK